MCDSCLTRIMVLVVVGSSRSEDSFRPQSPVVWRAVVGRPGENGISGGEDRESL